MLQQTFSLSKDEIVRGESFSHANEPMLTFNPIRSLVYVNAASLKRLPDMEYALPYLTDKRRRIIQTPSGGKEFSEKTTNEMK